MAGISPDMLFSDKLIPRSTFKLPMSKERVPTKKFDEKSKNKMSFRFQKVEGITEVNLLDPK